MENFEKTCRLCLNIISDTSFKIIQGIIIEVLDVLLLKLSTNKNKSVICNGCSIKLFVAFNFKATCMDTEDCIFPYINSEMGAPIDLKEIYLKERGKEHFRNILEDERICRLCMQVVTCGFTWVREVDVDMFLKYTPEVNFNSTKEPVICNICFDLLNTHTSFLKNCLDVNEKITSMCEDKAAESPSCIKCEDVEIKSEGNDDDRTPLDKTGWNDFGFHGSNQIPTPNIDALGYNGVILDKFYTQQTCTPSRAALLTGNYPIRSGLQGIPLQAGENRYVPLNMTVLPERLQELGYRTHLVGKWHLGHAYEKVTPVGRGFDTHFGYWSGFIGYFDYTLGAQLADGVTTYFGYDLHYNLTAQYQFKGQYSTELFSNKSLEIIDNHDEKEPLFLMVSHLAAHTGRGTELGVPNITKTNETYDYIELEERRRYADIVNIMDDTVGQIVNKLAEKDMLQNSIILFFSDNGPMTTGSVPNHGSSWPFRGLKFTLFEGGVRGSAVLYSPLLEKRGYINRELIHISDWLPTLYHAAGGNVSELGDIDGINQWDVISKNLTTTRTEILLNIDEFENQSAILGYEGQYKLVNGTYQDGLYDQYYGDSGRGSENPSYDTQQIINSLANQAIQTISNQSPLTSDVILNMRSLLDVSWCRDANSTPNFVCSGFCLFDIYSDPCETTNVVNDTKYENILQNLQAKLSEFYEQLVPQTNKAVDPNSDPSKSNDTWWNWLGTEP
ncbi:arylsulfatase B-like [Anoplophora glabripennis]|uniref:arylsulfatase B-like n=1 Tax=Anoplophora glabripennis TaxID=217634 RepID=UPI000C7606E8|nr:arylsulfatase B-like [Anoplophora glabripennis]